jgi:glutamate/tyrosine decarboxylase-like PLP-dependent enzyme
LQHRPVSPRPEAIERLNTLATPVPQRSTPSDEVLARLDEFVSPATMAMAGPRLEEIAQRWLLEMLNLPDQCAVGFVTGATVANFTALAAARNAVLKRCDSSVEADGLFGAPPIQVVVGEECHPTLLKSLGMLGLGRSRLTHVPTDSQGRIRAGKLPRLISPSIVCLQAGNINSGAFDSFDELCPIAPL